MGRSEQKGSITENSELVSSEGWCSLARGLRHQKKRPGVDFFAKDNSVGLTNLPNQARFYIW